MKISIVVAYWNRKQQLLNTLKSINQYGHDFKMIIVDDASTDGQDITYLASDNIRVVTLKDKWWINPCIPYNIGFSMVDTDLVMIQNPESYHVGDVIKHAMENIREGVYLNYSALALNGRETDRITAGEDIHTIIAPHMHSSIFVNDWDGNGWYNHPVYRQEMFHFCSVITRKDLYDLGGFDERYADGSAYDDNEFLCRIKKKGLRINMIENPFVIHQSHLPYYPGDVNILMTINGQKFEETKARHEYDVKPFNKFYK